MGGGRTWKFDCTFISTLFQQHKLQISTRNTYLEITLRKLGLVTELKLSPVSPGYELDG